MSMMKEWMEAYVRDTYGWTDKDFRLFRRMRREMDQAYLAWKKGQRDADTGSS